MAETFAMIKGTEASTRICAAIVDMRAELDIRNLEETAARAMGHVWMTDCDSLYEHLMSHRLNTIENKCLAIRSGSEAVNTVAEITHDGMTPAQCWQIHLPSRCPPTAW